LSDCVDALENTTPTEYFADRSDFERIAFIELLELAKEFVDTYESDKDDVRKLIGK